MGNNLNKLYKSLTVDEVSMNPIDFSQIEIEIEEEKITGSVMPDALVTSLSREQQLDLIAFVSSLGQPNAIKSEIVASIFP